MASTSSSWRGADGTPPWSSSGHNRALRGSNAAPCASRTSRTLLDLRLAAFSRGAGPRGRWLRRRLVPASAAGDRPAERERRQPERDADEHVRNGRRATSVFGEPLRVEHPREKVVYEPSVAEPASTSASPLNATPASRPRSSEPLALTTSVATGSSPPARAATSVCTRKRALAPTPPSTATPSHAQALMQ